MTRRCLILAMVLLLSIPSLAGAETMNDVTPSKLEFRKNDFTSLLKVDEIVKTGSKGNNLPAPQASLSIDQDGIYHVTSQGITISLSFPFGWMVLTQDYITQLAEYVQYVKDIGALVQEMASKGQQVFARSLEDVTGNFNVFLLEDGMAELLSIDDFNNTDSYLQEAMLDVYNSDYPSGKFSLMTAGNNTYIGALIQQDQYEIYTYNTFFGQKLVRIVVFSDGLHFNAQETEDIDFILSSLRLTAAK